MVSDGVTVAIEGAVQIDFLFPVVQVKIPGKEELSAHIVHLDKLLWGVDELTLFGCEGNEDIVTRHDEQEGIYVLLIIRKLAVLRFAAV